MANRPFRFQSRLKNVLSLLVFAGIWTVGVARAGEEARGSAGWERIPVPGARCGDGGEYSVFLKKGRREKVAFAFMGGGACWSESTCMGVEIRTLLPLGEIKAVSADVTGQGTGEVLGDASREYLFEPGAADVLGNLLPHYLNYQVYQFLQEAKASEHSARMVAMKNATDNAKQIIKDLTLEYNKLRQANITKELLEITTAQMAMG